MDVWKVVGKERGRKKSLNKDRRHGPQSRREGYENEIYHITHGDCPKMQREYVAKRVQEKMGIQKHLY